MTNCCSSRSCRGYNRGAFIHLTVWLLAHKLLYSVAGLANPDALFQASIFEGAFLDTRSSVCYGVFLAFGIFMFSLLRAYAPRLTIMSIYGTIALDIYCVSTQPFRPGMLCSLFASSRMLC